ncbi:hypothetical protein [Reinekea marinisedimentorum]|uniref:Uncharacterized protein n=1 Tax=Reinekea marinisedimentorum TaxID=230495 RepID=A0A4R3IAS3_9GAMM|nr:hypothetical protein [Reinekea marinisedimentorum]TCS42530.1 hypothetical protein BCF53_103191 [Reinekea marinisedimentorum]
MARPRYQINAKDWHDCLDWLDYQSQRTEWIAMPDHPVHEIGIHGLQERIAKWRALERPAKEDFRKVQLILDHSLTEQDRSRMRKSLSAKKRRRRDKRMLTKPVNVTLTPQAHATLVEFKELSSIETLSEAIETGLEAALQGLKARKEMERLKQLNHRLASLSWPELEGCARNYLKIAETRKSLSDNCKVALQMFLDDQCQSSANLLVDRLVEDLVWNELYLQVTAESLGIF